MTTFPTTTEHAPTTSGEALALAHRYASRGDPRDFEALVARYQSMVIATCRRVTGTHADAEDACQETFLKLARSAGTIRSNLGAWLHACARQTSIDLLRKVASRERAEGVAASDPAASAPEPAASRAWHEVRPMLDAALMQLDEADREIIIARFLMGRPQTEMAAEAGITPGSMHRRLDKALERLRDKLSKSGAARGVGVALPVVLGHAPAAEASPALSLALREIGLAGMSAAGSGTAAVSGAGAGAGLLGTALGVPLSGAALAGAVAAVIAVMTAGGVVMLGTFGAARGIVSSALTGVGSDAAAGPLSTPRPDRSSEALRLIAAEGAMPGMQLLHCEGNTLRLEKAAEFGGQPQTLHMVIERVAEGATEKQTDFTVRVTKCEGRDAEHQKAMLGNTMTLRMVAYGNGFALTMIDPPEMGTLSIVPDPTFKRPATVPPASETVRVPRLVGRWKELLDWALIASKDDLTIVRGPMAAYRFRVIQWTETDGHAKVQAICADSAAEAAMIGSRLKLLVRKDADGYTIAHHAAGSKRLNEWPSGFETKPGSDLRVLTFRKEAK